jgi:hypothetical protein
MYGCDIVENLDKILQIVITILTIALGALSAYLKTNEKIKSSSVKYIAEAEEIYKDATKAGGQKFAWVVDTLYNLVPAPMRIVITRSCIENIVQSTFDSIEAYAKAQLDKTIDKYLQNKD